MKKLIYGIMLACFAFASCEKEPEHTPVPIAPLLKEIVMPLESNTIPGMTATIQGKGFESSDVITCTSVAAEAPNFTAEIVGVTDYAVTIAIPTNAAGPYEVSVERAGLTTKLDARLNVAYVIPLEEVVVPANNVSRGASITVAGKGFENGDKVVFSSEAYPGNTTFEANTTLTADGISFIVPDSCYGINRITVIRGKRQTALGNLNIAVAVGDVLGGGVVYYTSDEGLHGLIVNKQNVGTGVDQWGPTSPHNGTKPDLYAGKENTRLCVEAMKDFHQRFDTWPLSKKSAAEMCDEHEVTVDNVKYDDWFLPSQQELIELFYAKDMLWNKDAGMPANNYWSSTEGIIPGDEFAHYWSAFYVNFYEPVNLVTACSDKEGWKIGVRPIRQF